MATQSEVRNTLLKVFDDGFADLQGPEIIPWTHDNLTADTSGSSIRVEVEIRQTASNQRTLGQPGNRRYRREGVLTATIYVQPGIGLYRAMEVAEGIRKIFEGRQIQGINPIGGVLVQEEGRDIAGYRVVVSYPHWYEERG